MPFVTRMSVVRVETTGLVSASSRTPKAAEVVLVDAEHDCHFFGRYDENDGWLDQFGQPLTARRWAALRYRPERRKR